MGIISREDYTLVSGRGVGNSLTDFLDSAERRIWVVSPRIDKRYARQLKRKYNRGVDVKLVTGGEHQSQEDALKQLLDSKNGGSGGGLFYRYRYPFLFITLLSLIGTAAGFWYESQFVAIPVALAVIFGGLTLLAYTMNGGRTTGYTSPVDLYLSRSGNSITNSRIYILDDNVLIGSADLTEDGLWKNMEMLLETRDEEARNQIESMFDDVIMEMERDNAKIEEIDSGVFEN